MRAPHFLYEQTPLAAFPEGKSIQYFAVSPDRTQIVFSTVHHRTPGMIAVDGSDLVYETFLASVGGAYQRAEALDGASAYQWQGDGSALVYGQALTKPVPGEQDGMGRPKVEVLGHRLVRQPITGGDPQVLAEFGADFSPGILANPKTNQVMVYNDKHGVWLVDGDGTAPRKLHDAARFDRDLMAWSPDGHRLAFVAKDPSGKLPTEVRMVDVVTSQTHAVRGDATLLAWTADSERLQIIRIDQRALEAAPPLLHVATHPFSGGEPTERNVELRHPESGQGYQSFYHVKASPDGSRLIGEAGGTILLDLGSLGITVLGDRVELRGWFDNEHIMYKELVGRAPGIFTATVPRDLAPGTIPAASIPRTVRTFVDLKLPERAKVGQPVPITLSFLATSACETPTAAYAMVDDWVRYVYLDGVISKRTDAGACSPAISYPTYTITFTPKSAGTYKFPIEIDANHAQGAAAAKVRGLGGTQKVTFELEVTN